MKNVEYIKRNISKSEKILLIHLKFNLNGNFAMCVSGEREEFPMKQIEIQMNKTKRIQELVQFPESRTRIPRFIETFTTSVSETGGAITGESIFTFWPSGYSTKTEK